MSAAPSDKTAPAPTPAQPAPAPPAPAPPVPVAQTPLVETPASPPVGRSPVGLVLLLVTGALFVGWMSWLGYTALTKSGAPVVSRAQAAAATVAVRAKLTTGNKDLRAAHERRESGNNTMTDVLGGKDDKPAFIVTVVEPLTRNGPAKDAQIGVVNLPTCSGYTGEGEYLLLLDKDPEATIDGRPSYYIVGIPRSPGSEPAFGASPPIYPWTDATGDDLHEQIKRLFP